jgi:hypothetical protein
MTPFERWMTDLEARYLADLRFAEVTRALRALSSIYVERRARLREGAAFSSAGKRAAFALFYGPLHFLLVREIVSALGATVVPAPLVDLGCGTGAAGAAWAHLCAAPPALVGLDRHPWAVEEAARTYRTFGLTGRTRLADAARGFGTRGPSSLVAAFALNELDDAGRDGALAGRLERAAPAPVLVVEPLARAAAPWWGRLRAQCVAAGGRADEWRFRIELPPIVARLDRAAGLDHRELTARSLWRA